MEYFFHTVHITNFKSLKDVTLSDCKRINLLIGRPNVGKSNILEAIGLFGLPYLHRNKNKKITEFVRLENLPELFFNGNVSHPIYIETDDKRVCCYAHFSERDDAVFFSVKTKNPTNSFIFPESNTANTLEGFDLHYESCHFSVNNELVFNDKDKNFKSTLPNTKFYRFLPNTLLGKSNIYTSSLLPPSGLNIFDVLLKSTELRAHFSSIFSEYGLKILLDKSEHALRLMKILDEDNIISFPYVSIADTLQRLIFFKAAIESNQNAVLLFEEPEAHCFPPYIRHITQDILDSETNQFFIATHSPYVLNDFLEYERNDVAIFIANFKNGETVIRRLTNEEVNDVYQYGIDLFFNHELFTDDQEH